MGLKPSYWQRVPPAGSSVWVPFPLETPVSGLNLFQFPQADPVPWTVTSFLPLPKTATIGEVFFTFLTPIIHGNIPMLKTSD